MEEDHLWKCKCLPSPCDINIWGAPSVVFKTINPLGGLVIYVLISVVVTANKILSTNSLLINCCLAIVATSANVIADSCALVGCVVVLFQLVIMICWFQGSANVKVALLSPFDWA